MYVHTRRALVVAALFAIAGCSGASVPGGSSAGQSGSSTQSSVVHRGMPFVPFMRQNVMRHSAQPAFPTRKSLVFEADQAEAAVNIYKTKALPSNPAPIAMIHVAAGCPYGMAVDKTGKIYVADNCGGNDVEEYAKGSTTLSSTITSGISNPLGLAIDKNGTLYVSNYPASITEYAYGTNTPSKTVTGGGMTDPFGLALDSSGNLYIADFGASAVFELPAGGSSVTNLGLSGLGEPLGLAIDQTNGYLWETGGSGDVINIYKLGGSTSPIQTIPGNGNPYAISLELIGKPKGEVVESDLGTHDVYAYKPGQYTSYATLSNGISLPTGLLITKP
jgi:sugar lactone lactonase YvrE